MRRNFLLAAVAVAACTGLTLAQSQTTSARASQETSVNRDGRQLHIASGTRLTAELQSTLDASRARVGDRVVLKTTEAVKAGGENIVKKGARLVGHVSAVGQSAKGNAESSVTVLFDRLESGALSTPISLTIDSVTQARTRAGDDDYDTSARSSTSARTQGGASTGGLLGGVAGAVGSTVGGATTAAGEVVGTTTETAGGAVRALGRVRVSQSLDASAEGGSTLSLNGGLLRLEKGTTFRLTVQESASVGNN